MNKDIALKLALKELVFYRDWAQCQDWRDESQTAITAIKEALAEPEPNYKKALEVWLDKTEWVQETVKPHELGMHRADVLKQRIQEVSLQRTWVGLTDKEIDQGLLRTPYAMKTAEAWREGVIWAYQQLKEKNDE